MIYALPLASEVHALVFSSALCVSPLVPGLLVTGSADDSLKFWDILDGKPTFLFNRDMHMVSVDYCTCTT